LKATSGDQDTKPRALLTREIWGLWGTARLQNRPCAHIIAKLRIYGRNRSKPPGFLIHAQSLNLRMYGFSRRFFAQVWSNPRKNKALRVLPRAHLKQSLDEIGRVCTP
jgi:hypothetical protein